jgi:YfiH family protein
LNLAQHVEDESRHVEKNRALLASDTEMPQPKWLEQTHSTKVIEHSSDSFDADGCFTRQESATCLVMTADCLPVLLCNQAGDWVAAVHAGWRGLAQGILSKAVKKYSGPSALMGWIGPAISQKQFEVGAEVRQSFISKSNELETYFKATNNQKWLCDLSGLAEKELKANGVTVFQSGLCTYSKSEQFYSHRRQTHQFGASATTGRMATAIWIQSRKQ